MSQTHLGALVAAFTELWALEAAANDRLQLGKSAFSGKLPYILGAILCIGFYVAFQTEWKTVGWLLLIVGGAWLSGMVSDYHAADTASQELERIRWKDFDLRFQWRAFGLFDDQLRGLKKMWLPRQSLDGDRPEYRQWWQMALDTAKERGMR